MMNMRGETSLVPARRMLLKNATWPSSSSAPHSPFFYFISRGGSDCRKTSFILSNLLKIFCYSQELTLTDQGRIWFIISLYCTINPDRTPPGTHLTIILNNIVIPTPVTSRASSSELLNCWQVVDQCVRGGHHPQAVEVPRGEEGLPPPLVPLLHRRHERSAGETQSFMRLLNSCLEMLQSMNE